MPLCVLTLLKTRQPNPWSHMGELLTGFCVVYLAVRGLTLYSAAEYCQSHLSLWLNNANSEWKQQVGSKEQQMSHSQRLLILFLLFCLMVHVRGRCYCLFLSCSLTDIQNNNTWNICKTIITNKWHHNPPPHPTEKKLETLTDKVTYRVQQHKHNVQMLSVTTTTITETR